MTLAPRPQLTPADFEEALAARAILLALRPSKGDDLAVD